LALTGGLALAVAPTVVAILVDVPQAVAWCDGVGQPRDAQLPQLQARESANTNACNANNLYSGHVEKFTGDNECVYVKLTENGGSNFWVQQTVCAPFGSANYSYEDSDGAVGISLWGYGTATTWKPSHGA
jgi:hypothetical protein